MKISYNWLKEFVDLKISPKDLSEKLISLGFGIASIEKHGEDCILDVEITANRGDCLSIIGIAREISASLNISLRIPRIDICEDGEKIENFLSVEVKDKFLCPRYTARVIKGIKIGPSPLWMSQRLESLGVRSINNVVDATNYVLIERGQPLHAFDYSLIKEGKIIVRRANQDEVFTTLDGVSRKLNKNMLVIADPEKPIALAGVMGGANTEVNNATVDIVIESACFNAGNIRKTSQTLGFSTMSSYRFERSSDIEEARISVDRVCSLIKEIAGGSILKGVIDRYSLKHKFKKIKVYFSRINQILGMEIPKKEVIGILRRLGFKVENRKSSLKVEVPSSRAADITREIDIIEEVARHYGYDEVRSTIPPLNFEEEDNIKYSSIGSDSLSIQDEARDVMKDAGFFECVNYGIMKRGIFEKIFSNLDRLVRISNPLDEEMNILRPSLIPGLMENLLFNFNRDIDSIKIFEIGRIFEKSNEKLPIEKVILSGLISGVAGKFWAEKQRTFNFYDLKGTIEYLFERLGIVNFSFKFCPENESLLMSEGLKIFVNNREIGESGKLKNEIIQFYKLPEEVYFFEINLESIKEYRSIDKKYTPFSKFPFIKRDAALIVPVEMSAGEVRDMIKKEGGPLLQEVLLFDYYRGEQVPEGYKSLGFTLVYQSKERTLTDGEVNNLHFHIIQRLSERGIQLRKA